MERRFKAYRKDKNYTQLEAAKLLGITRQSLSNYETGKRNPPIPILITMAKIYGITIDELVAEEEVQTEELAQGAINSTSTKDISINGDTEKKTGEMRMNIRKLKELLNSYDDKMCVTISVTQMLGQDDDYETIEHDLHIKKLSCMCNHVSIETEELIE